MNIDRFTVDSVTSLLRPSDNREIQGQLQARDGAVESDRVTALFQALSLEPAENPAKLAGIIGSYLETDEAKSVLAVILKVFSPQSDQVLGCAAAQAATERAQEAPRSAARTAIVTAIKNYLKPGGKELPSSLIAGGGELVSLGILPGEYDIFDFDDQDGEDKVTPILHFLIAQCPNLYTLGIHTLMNPRSVVDSSHIALLSQLKHLENLSFENCHDLTDVEMAPLERLTHLQSLILAGTYLGDKTLGHVGKCLGLVSLNLKLTQITDKGVESIAHLTSLAHLDLTCCRALTHACFTSLQEMNALRTLSLEGCSRIDDAAMVAFSNSMTGVVLQSAGANLDAGNTQNGFAPVQAQLATGGPGAAADERVRAVAMASAAISPPGGLSCEPNSADVSGLETDSEPVLDFSDYSPEAIATLAARSAAYERAKLFLSAEYKKQGQNVPPDLVFAAVQIATAQVLKQPLIDETAIKIIKQLGLEGTEWDVKGIKHDVGLSFSS